MEKPRVKKTNEPCVYILKCADNTLYTGWTNDVEKRVQAHNAKKGAKYTKSRVPVELMYVEYLPTKADALMREKGVKKLTRAKKLKLIENRSID